MLKGHATTSEVGDEAIQRLLRLGSNVNGLVVHDNRHAPEVNLPPEIRNVALNAASGPLLISLTDEDVHAAALAVSVKAGVPLCGVGIDLASVADFANSPHSERFFTFLFTSRELSFIYSYPKEKWEIIACALFSAKESAIKSVAPLVREYESSRPGCRLKARFSELEVHLHGNQSLVLSTRSTAEHMKLIGVSELRCTIVPGKDYVFTAARCTATNPRG